MNRLIVLLFALPFLALASEPSLSVYITGCAQSQTGMPVQTRSPQQAVEPKIEVASGGIRYFRAGMHQCCRKVEVRKAVRKERITLTEFWTGEGCRCMCFSQIEATLTNLVAGEYKVAVFSGGIESGTHKNIEPKEVLSQNVKIP